MTKIARVVAEDATIMLVAWAIMMMIIMVWLRYVERPRLQHDLLRLPRAVPEVVVLSDRHQVEVWVGGERISHVGK